MKNVLTVSQVREAEANIMRGGVSEIFLRIDAALAVADTVCAHVKEKRDADIAVLCGPGGNGYDGLLAAVRLMRLGYKVKAYLAGDASKFDKNVMAYVKNEKLPVLSCEQYNSDADCIVDAIFGIGLNREITGETKELIEKINAQKNALKIAVDIPSGLNGDSGEVCGICVRADMTVTFSCYKLGMLFGKGRSVCGKIIVADVGVGEKSVLHVYEDGDFTPYSRDKAAHKGTAGRVFVIGGSGSMIGAPMLAAAAAHAAYLNGAGTVTVCLPDIHRTALAARASMAMMKFMPSDGNGYIKFDKPALDEIMQKASAINIGMGMGADPELNKSVRYLCENYDKTIVIDADALNAIKGDYGFLRSAKARLVLTPHVGEFTRLTGKEASVDNALEFARETGAITVLKSATTIITDGKEVRINLAGTPAMAKGGMGDTLGGCIAALSCSFAPIDAATIACYRNGEGAERAVSSYAEMMLTAGEVLKYADYDE